MINYDKATLLSATLTSRVPSARVVISTVYVLCVLVPLAYLTLVGILGLDPNGPDTARQEMIAIASSEPPPW